MVTLVLVYKMLRKYFNIYSIFYIMTLSFLVMFFEAFTISLVVPILSSSLSGGTEYFISNMFLNTFINNFETKNIIILLIISLTIFFVLKFLFLTYALFAQTNFYIKFKILLSENVFRGYLEMPYSTHVKTNSSIILRNTINETEMVSGILKQIILIITEALVFLGISFVLFLYQPFESLIIIIYILSAVLLFYYLIRKRLLNWGKLRQYHEGQRIQKINEGIKGIIEVKLAKNFNFFFNSFIKHNNISNSVHKKRTIVGNLPKIWLQFILLIALLLLATLFVIYDKDFNKALPMIGLFAAAAFRIIPSVQRILVSYQALRFQLPAVNKVYNEIEKFKLNNTNINETNIDFIRKIEFNNVTFSYPSKKQITIFKNLNFTINKGDFIGIIGTSGTGKTTFFNLIAGLISPNSGKIYIDDIDLMEQSIYWTKKVGYVPQDTFILDGSLKENITLDMNNMINQEKLTDVIINTDLEGLVESLDHGLDTNIGEGGQKISGGQKQRIGIARALYKNPSLLIFDEVTSSLDEKTEINILKTINKLNKIKTILIISHRKEILNSCNKIYNLSKQNFDKVNS